MRDIRRISLALNLEDELQARAYSILKQAPHGSRTNFICRAVCSCENNSILIDEIRHAINEEFRNIGPMSFSTTQLNTNDKEAEQINDDVLGFLRSLEGSDDD